MIIIKDDQNVISASVASIVSERPKFFKTDDGVIGVAVLGVLMPYNIFIMSLIAHLHGVNSLTDTIELPHKREEKLRDHMNGLYRGVSVPERFARAFRQAPWDAADQAVIAMLASIRRQETKKADLITMIREIEEDYADLYVASEPAYHTLKAVKQRSFSFADLISAKARVD